MRELGWAVAHTHEVGNGFYDLVCSKYGINVIVEVKDSLKPPSARSLTDKQKEFNMMWTGLRCVVKCKADCHHLDKQINEMHKKLQAAGIEMRVTGCEDYIYEPSLY